MDSTMKKLIKEESGPAVTIDGKTWTTYGTAYVVQLWEDENGVRLITLRIKTKEERQWKKH